MPWKKDFSYHMTIPEKVVKCISLSGGQKFLVTLSRCKGIFRAVIKNIKNISQNKRLEGASTITQQVAKNFYLLMKFL